VALRPEAAAHPLAAVLRTVGEACCPGRVNLHCHSLHSDGSLTPADLAEQAMAIGLEHLAITDHHSLGGHAEAEAVFAAAAASGRRVPSLWRGVEISCLLEGCLVHVLALGFHRDHASLSPYLTGAAAHGAALRAEAVQAAVAAAGGLALLAHPARYRLPHPRMIAAAERAGLDGAEAWYDYELLPRWRPSPLVCEAIAADLRDRGLLLSCGTDTHGLALHGR
jgi:predicted metal-dependent phosphoesterase TrpH